jgi:hypothetical protein
MLGINSKNCSTMVSKGLIGATALAISLASAGAFAPGRTFVKSPLSPATYGIEKAVNVDGAVAYGNKLSQVCLLICERRSTVCYKLYP